MTRGYAICLFDYILGSIPHARHAIAPSCPPTTSREEDPTQSSGYAGVCTADNAREAPSGRQLGKWLIQYSRFETSILSGVKRRFSKTRNPRQEGRCINRKRHVLGKAPPELSPWWRVSPNLTVLRAISGMCAGIWCVLIDGHGVNVT